MFVEFPVGRWMGRDFDFVEAVCDEFGNWDPDPSTIPACVRKCMTVNLL